MKPEMQNQKDMIQRINDLECALRLIDRRLACEGYKETGFTRRMIESALGGKR